MPDLVHPANFVVFVKSARNAGSLVGDYTTARAVLADWECRSPNDLGATRLRAEVEFLAGAYLPALHAVEKVLAKQPDDAEMRALGERCRSKLRVDVAPPPRLVK
jgi:hypothetical protein